jgi:hypothetical protein
MKKIIKITNLTYKVKLLHLIKQNNLKIDNFSSLNNVMNKIFIQETLGSLFPLLDIQKARKLIVEVVSPLASLFV